VFKGKSQEASQAAFSLKDVTAMSASPILLLSHPMDVHAMAVAEGLRRKGAPYAVWHTADFPSRSGESISFRRGQLAIKVEGPELLIAQREFGTIWYRRPLTQPDQELLHPADRLFARQHCEAFRRALLRLLGPEAFWVNSPAASDLAKQKVLQQHAALFCGFEMPDTLYSNDPDEIRRFIASQGGRVIFKILTGAPWRDGRTRWVSYAAPLSQDQLVEDDLLRQTPSIYQAIVPKAYELRVTVMGRQVFTAQVLSQETAEGKLDWRRAYRELEMRPAELPTEVRERCFLLMERLGIVFGCFDFIVTPEGEHVFLEVNEAGQFLFVEEYTGLPLLDAFCEFLISADPAFEYGPRPEALRFSDLVACLGSLTADAAERHVVAVPPDYDESLETSPSR
jgi:glutathione synthase/RimK-type ligase-like ATP-grasp enzyme